VQRDRLVVIVNGTPGSGKTALSGPLSEALGVPLFGKDIIKETWANILGASPSGDRSQQEWSMMFGAAANETIWSLLEVSPCGGVVDSPLPPRMRHHVEAGLAKVGVRRPLEIWCSVPESVVWKRREERAESRHAIHGVSSPPAKVPGQHRVFEPLNFGPVLCLDTSEPVDITEVVSWCRTHWRSG
jgi:predicted kinase